MPPSVTATLPKVTASGNDTATYLQRTAEFHEACERGRLSLMLQLIEQGSNINDKGDQGQTALHRAAAGGHRSVIAVLLALGADVDERDSQGRTPLMAAAASGRAEIVSLLRDSKEIDRLATLSLETCSELAASKLEGLTERLKDDLADLVDASDLEGRTALMIAASGGQVSCVRNLLGETYLASRAQLEARDREGRNALLIAAEAGQAPVVDVLLHSWRDEGPGPAYLRSTDSSGRTALDLARQGGHKLVVKLLEVDFGLAGRKDSEEIDLQRGLAEVHGFVALAG